MRSKSWVVWVTALSLALGGLIAASVRTQHRFKSRFGVSPGRGGGIVAALTEQSEINAQLRAEIGDLRGKNTEWEKRFAGGASDTRALGEELQKVKLLAGLVSVEGEGVIVTLQDSRKKPEDIAPGLSKGMLREMNGIGIVHAQDIREVVDELFAAGAEAVAVNDLRIVATTAIRCVGPVTQVNTVEVSSPVEIKAIGNTKTIMGGLRTPGGLLESELGALGMIKVQEGANIVLPLYTGSTKMKYAHVAREGN
jgi:uncharacterized protein YlxW (UPF0749 family)